MGSEKIFMFGEPSTGGRADLTAILPALMNNNKGIHNKRKHLAIK